MTEVFGGQSVGFVVVSKDGEPGYLGVISPTRALTVVSGCHFRPLSASEEPVGATDVATEVWKLTGPPSVLELATSTGELIYDGTADPELPDDPNHPSVFGIVGPPSPKFDLDGSLHHVTVLAKRQAG